MYKKHTAFILPNENQKIWRYLDFPKFFDLLNNSSLFFARADTLNDVFEGSLPIQTVQNRDDSEKELLKKYPNRMQYDWKKIGLQQKTHMAINCWCMNDNESNAMWQLYCKANNGIAIQSTFAKLKASFADSPQIVHIGKISYIDYNSGDIDLGNGFYPFLHKNISFEHERELRAVIWEQALENQKIVNLTDGGQSIVCDLSKLIECIYVAPGSKTWFENIVKKVVANYSFNFPVKLSNLDATPVF